MYLNQDDCSAGIAEEKKPVCDKFRTTAIGKKPKSLRIPDYLQKTYWWAYLHPRAVKIFERQWLVNLILFGNYRRLQKEVLKEIKDNTEGDVLQVACVYGDFSRLISQQLSGQGKLHILDIAPVQLDNVKEKLANHSNVVVHHQDSSSLDFKDYSFNTVIVFFLLHEQPESVRQQTVEEAFRVTGKSGKTIFIDYHRPKWYSPFRWIIDPVLRMLEPYAHDLWRQDIHSYLSSAVDLQSLSKSTFFMEQYQKVVMTKSLA